MTLVLRPCSRTSVNLRTKPALAAGMDQYPDVAAGSEPDRVKARQSALHHKALYCSQCSIYSSSVQVRTPDRHRRLPGIFGQVSLLVLYV